MNQSMKLTLVAAAVLGLAGACQNAVAADGYEVAGQLKNAPAGTVLHLGELTGNQFVEKTRLRPMPTENSSSKARRWPPASTS